MVTFNAGSKVTAASLNVLGTLQQIGTTQVLAVAAASVTFSSIPTTYTALKLYSYCRGDTAATLINSLIQFNSDTGTNYQDQYAEFSPSAAGAEAYAQTSIQIGKPPAASASAKMFGVGETLIGGPGQGGSQYVPLISTWCGMFTTSTGGAKQSLYGGTYLASAPVTSIQIITSSGNFVAGSRFSLYGVT